ncbi:sulfatase/phosphatase domain-containing protein [Paenibacillus sp. HB172176]|uniref:sulfatase/phosphatase domain-containing protein n=1 Tax=Paenibacillus sp. HB172176 TaxID=2493690 RepID=UPI001F11040D|nr:sulfatase/phosphatase domain-containing protein [Paenibacillus sp. HB172176]
MVQTIDLAPTLLDYFQVVIPEDMQGKSLKGTVEKDEPIRKYALFGIHGGHVNMTDGRYVYMRAPVEPENRPLYNYTLMPAHMRGLFKESELLAMELAEPFSFTKGFKTMKTPAQARSEAHPFGTLLFDLERDPGQLYPIKDSDIEVGLLEEMARLMKDADAPSEQYERLGMI